MIIEPMQVVALFLWAFSEAVFWPFMPDALLVPMAAFQPSTWWMLIPIAVAGSATGGVASYVLARQVDVAAVLGRMPFVRPTMVTQCDRWLTTEGARGVRHQALAMVPFKVFAFTAGKLQVPVLQFIAWAMLVRGARFLVVCAIAAVAGIILKTPLALYPIPFLLAWAVAFYIALIMMVKRWEKADVRPD
jgi:membrane protein YqaA with SNARE-associated domain